jgi:hypothetical protein
MAASASKPELTKDMAHTVAPIGMTDYKFVCKFAVLTSPLNSMRVAASLRRYRRVRIETRANQGHGAYSRATSE